MPEKIGDRLRHAWNAFMSRDPPSDKSDIWSYQDLGTSYSYRPDRPIVSVKNDKSMASIIYNKIAVDCASLTIKHARLDQNGRFVEPIDSGLNYCLNTEANVDQTGRALMEDIVISMFDEGVVALVPVETNINPNNSLSFDVCQLRTGKIIQWYPRHVKIRLYNDKTGKFEDITMAKTAVAIIENPFFAIMNEPNSTMQRLIRKLALLDVVDEQSSSGKLDLIIQLPYVIKSDQKKQQAEARRKDIETQLTSSKYGIAYTDGTERITQLNRSVENNLLKQIEYLTDLLYSQLGISRSILDGTADEKTMLNYNNRIIEPVMSTIADEIYRKFLSKTARTQRQAIVYFRDPFKLVPIAQIAEIADKFTRNEIMSSNEIRQLVGLKPVDDPNADELRNKNLNRQEGLPPPSVDDQEYYDLPEDIVDQEN